MNGRLSKTGHLLALLLILASALIAGTFEMSVVSADREKVAKPTFVPVGGTYSSPQSVTIQCATVGATIRYTTDGSTPSSSSTLYSGPIMVDATTTIKAKAYKTQMADSDTASATYTINIPIKVATPTLSPPGGTYSSAQNVTLSCSTEGANIRYTTDGSEPSSLSPLYANPIYVGSTTTIKAKAFNKDMIDSDTAEASYTIAAEPPPTRVSTPTFSPPAGAFSLAQNVTISCATSGATIRYTIDGSEPSSSSTAYATPISVSMTTTIKAKAFVSGMIDSNTISVVYIINLPKVDMPTLSPAGGFYSNVQSAVIQCSTSGAAIHYTISGAEPSSSSPIYSGPISISATTTIKAKAIMSGMADSDTSSATYTIITSARSQELSFEYDAVYVAITTFAIFVVAGVLVLYLKSRKKPT